MAVFTLTPSSDGHDPRQVGDLERVLEDVLTVARPVAQTPEHLDELLVHLAAVRLEHGLLAGLADVLLDLRLRLVEHLLDPRRVDPAVLDELGERELRDLAAHAVEGRQHDGLRSVVDDELDAREVLERTDVAALATDDAPLHVVGRQLDERDGRLGRVARGDPLERVRDEVARPLLRVRLRLLLDLAHHPRHLVTHELLAATEELRRAPRSAVMPETRSSSRSWTSFACSSLDLEAGELRPRARRATAPAARARRASRSISSSFSSTRSSIRMISARLSVSSWSISRSQPDGLLARLDLCLAADGLGVALGVGEQPLPLLGGRLDAVAEHEPRQPTYAPAAPDRETDQDPYH